MVCINYSGGEIHNLLFIDSVGHEISLLLFFIFFYIYAAWAICFGDAESSDIVLKFIVT